MMAEHLTYREVLAEATRYLEGADVEEASDSAWQLFEAVFEIDRTHYFLRQWEKVDAEKQERYWELLKRRANHEPLQYLLGRAWFCGLEFLVDDRVLIPRFDTEILVEEVLKAEAKKGDLRMLDMCAGSGCIGLASARLLQEKGSFVQLTSADLSKDALAVTSANAKKLGVACECIQTDLFAELEDRTFDVIVSNPPYIVADVIEGLMEEVRFHEPRMALDGGEDGLDFYRRIAKEGKRFLRDGGRIYLEIGHDQGASVPALLEAEGFLEVKMIRDLAGNPRVVKGKK